MLEVKPTEKEFSLYMDYCINLQNNGSFRYLSEVSIPDEKYESFVVWLDKCEKIGFTYMFVVIERYPGYKLLYGFTNFEIKEFKGSESFYFSVLNDEVLYDYFYLWKKESSFFLLPSDLYNYLSVLASCSKNAQEQ